ncbi:MAG: hypothetical protein ACLPG2_01625, partial [Rhodoblastus sp.]
DWYDNQGTRLVETLTERGGEVVSQIVAFSESAVGALAARSNELIAHLGRRQNEMTGALDETNRRVTQGLDGLLANLANTQGALLTTVDRAETGLTQVHGALAPRIDALAATIATLHGEADRLDETARHVESGIGGAAQAVQGQAQTLQEALRDLNVAHAMIGRAFDARLRELSAAQSQVDEALQARLNDASNAQQAIDAAVEARMHSLQALHEEAAKQQNEYEMRLDGFAAMIARTLSQADARAREVGAFLASAAAGTAGVLTRQHDELRDQTAREREKTAAELNAAHEQTLAQMNQLLQQASERYKGVSQELRAMTGEIQRELEATRQELKRGMVDLPRETGEQAATMRKIVADEMKALTELTDLVAGSGRTFDVVEPQEPARVEPARPEPAPRREPVGETLVREAPRFDPRPQPVRPAVAAPAPAAPAERGGWMSDLLARASADEPVSRRAATPADSLDNLSADIARAVDEGALLDAWTRLRRGERSAFSRRIYTPQGQKTFDDVRQRYGEDREFRLTVDRYVQEFERLLGDVGRQDRDGLLTRSYLGSETGKVYSLLAHASGRLG